MSDLSVAAVSPGSNVPQPAAVADNAPSLSFHELLSDLNPLQYIPVIGTIYRSVTGDTIPDSVRTIGSLVFSGLTGGPIGLATNVALLALEKVTGIDPEQIGHNALASLGIGASPSATPSASSAPAALPAAALAKLPSEPWSTSQLTAYGVTRTTDGMLRRGALVGSDVLNDLELARARNGDSSATALAAL